MPARERLRLDCAEFTNSLGYKLRISIKKRKETKDNEIIFPYSNLPHSREKSVVRHTIIQRKTRIMWKFENK